MAKKWVSVIYFLVLVLVLSACNKTDHNSLIEDAEAFCNLHEKDYWVGADSNLSIEQLEKLVADRASKEINTEEFKAIVKELQNVEYYRDLYPTAKQRIEKFSGEPWDCAAY